MFEYKNDCKTGIENIDEEHKYLFELLNKAHILSTTDYHGDYYHRIKEMMAELDSYAEQHFSHEEEYMTQIRDPELFSQRKQHAFFREKILTLDLVNIDDIKEQQRVLTELVNFLAKWLYSHILSSDMLIGKLAPLEEWMVEENPCEFTQAYLVGIDLIDREHKEIFRIADKAFQMVKYYNASAGFDDIVTALNELKVCIAEHFDDEEAYMEEIHYEALDAQKRAHAAYIDKLENINFSEAEKNPQKYFQKLIEFLIGWLINHITNMDKKISASMSKT